MADTEEVYNPGEFFSEPPLLQRCHDDIKVWFIIIIIINLFKVDELQ